jgi:hypothetical protein
MKREEDSELWDLLGKAAEPAAISPFFARDVLRRVRQEPTWRDRLTGWFRPARLIPAAGVAVAIIAASMALHQPQRNDDGVDDPPDVVANIDPQDYDAVVDLDDLLASEDDSVWTENESLSL